MSFTEPEGMLFHDFAVLLSQQTQQGFRESCSDHFLLQFPFTRGAASKAEAQTRRTSRLEPQAAMIDATMQLSLESVLGAARGKTQARGATIHAVPTASGPHSLGRKAGVDLVLPEPTVSSRHAEIHFKGGQWTVVDLSSQNGTYVDAKRINANEPVEFSADASLWFASYRTIFLSPDKAFEVAQKFGEQA
jgi:hypothetical protein